MISRFHYLNTIFPRHSLIYPHSFKSPRSNNNRHTNLISLSFKLIISLFSNHHPRLLLIFRWFTLDNKHNLKTFTTHKLINHNIILTPPITPTPNLLQISPHNLLPPIPLLNIPRPLLHTDINHRFTTQRIRYTIRCSKKYIIRLCYYTISSDDIFVLELDICAEDIFDVVV